VADNQRIEELRRRVQKDPASIAFAQLAEECRRAGQLEESIEICRAGLNIHPGYLSARVTLGRALVELNQLDEGLAELRHVLASAPENLAALRGVAEIHHRRGELADALTHYRAALALARNDPDLEQTVEDLARQVEPARPAVAADGLSLEQMTRELSVHLPAAPVTPAPGPIERDESAGLEWALAETPLPAAPWPETEPVPPEAGMGGAELAPSAAAQAAEPDPPLDPERERARKTIDALEQWLDAVHVARTEPRS
jgi:tetratricopeptide (TPR) repeat protein